MSIPTPKDMGNIYRRIQIKDSATSHLGDTFITYPNPKPIDYYSNFSYTLRRPKKSYFPRPNLEQKIRNILRPINPNVDPPAESRNLDPNIAILTGPEEAGKTQLALRYLHTHRASYTATFFIDASDQNTLKRDFKALFRTLFSFFICPGPICDSRDAVTAVIEIDDESAVLGVKYWFQTLSEQEKLRGSQKKRRYLLILDGVGNVGGDEDGDEVENGDDVVAQDEDDGEGFDLGFYIPDAPDVDVIITTRAIEDVGAVADLGEEISVPCRADWLYDS
ncbi:hypothetical protein PHISCL_01333 [Aspergillus sclerotialis]|uniref:Uncharacterized protein n=1 Tax=Aspergillus sclerotialis TaxID=2070753 RepID=A0A3A2ZUG8_9EURO|nr:hypothetical protein PHISCL_01333 [Aspergillus sclerotialis]